MLRLDNVRKYINSLGWIGPDIVVDLNSVLDYISLEDLDSVALTNQWRRAMVILHHWEQHSDEQVKLIDHKLTALWAEKDPEVRREIVKRGQTIRESSVKAGIEATPEYSTMSNSSTSWRRLRDTLKGMRDALDASVIVQESVNLRHQEQEDPTRN